MLGIEMRQSELLEASSAVVVGQGICRDCGLPRPIPDWPAYYSDSSRECRPLRGVFCLDSWSYGCSSPLAKQTWGHTDEAVAWWDAGGFEQQAPGSASI
jgi:hypothetical protein